ncbi:hypothetical protein I5Q82_07980 [Acutalibacter muris]|uniref:Uncharacterized protein n=1 Tax=Acutalibacter muris TaxID=1796620 RepID=A0AA92L9P6_9FIRM|nr:hypothetical protein [Acutalibacter muris]MCI9193584.1 hypothetical protein [Acutalibacter muris]QQR31584.1 hypothetical protein I5Q82_07980 [Acutalibacter muris]
MKQRMLGFFSGFPSHHFPREIAERLKESLIERGRRYGRPPAYSLWAGTRAFSFRG